MKLMKLVEGHPLYPIVGAAMSVQDTLGLEAMPGLYLQSLPKKLRAKGYTVDKAAPITVVDKDNDTLGDIQPDFWIEERKLLIKVYFTQRKMGDTHFDTARKYLQFNRDAKNVLLINFRITPLDFQVFPKKIEITTPKEK